MNAPHCTGTCQQGRAACHCDTGAGSTRQPSNSAHPKIASGNTSPWIEAGSHTLFAGGPWRWLGLGVAALFVVLAVVHTAASLAG